MSRNFPLPEVEQVRLWSPDELLQWFEMAGLNDCAPAFSKRNVSGEQFMNLTEDDLLGWHELTSLQKRHLANCLKNARKITVNNKGGKAFKGIFETLSRRKKVPAKPFPIPADYHPTFTNNLTPIFISENEISPSKSTTTNDWGSEFSDSDAEDCHFNDHQKKAHKIDRPTVLPSHNQPDENLYEIPEEAKNSTVDVLNNRLMLRRSTSETGQIATRNHEPERKSHPVTESQVAQRLNQLLANRRSLSVYAAPTVLPQTSEDIYSDTKGNIALPPKPPSLALNCPLSDPLEPFCWYHGGIDRAEACRLLQCSIGHDGTFLVRRSIKGGEKFSNPYSLSLIYAGKVFHLTIRQRNSDKLFALGFEKKGEKTFTSVEDMVEYHYKNPLFLAECNHGVFLVLTLTRKVIV